MATPRSSARYTDLNVTSAAMLILEAFRNRYGTTWSSCDDRRERAFAHDIGRTSQLDYILEPKMDSSFGVHAQQGQVVQFLGPLSSVRSDSRRICTRLFYSIEEEGMAQDFKKDSDGPERREVLETIQIRVEKRQRRSPTRRGTGEEFQTV